MKTFQILSGGLLLITVLLAAAQPEFSQSTPNTPPATAAPILSLAEIEVAPQMDAVPSNCGILAEPLPVDPMITNAVGAWPVWIALPNGGDDQKGILSVPNRHNFTAPGLEGWWTTKVAWFIAQTYHGEVRVSGFNVDDHSPIYFEFNGGDPVDIAVLNPASPGGFVDDLVNYAFFPSHMWVSKAGCYRLQAEWDGGLWQQVIAVGNTED